MLLACPITSTAFDDPVNTLIVEVDEVYLNWIRKSMNQVTRLTKKDPRLDSMSFSDTKPRWVESTTDYRADDGGELWGPDSLQGQDLLMSSDCPVESVVLVASPNYFCWRAEVDNEAGTAVLETPLLGRERLDELLIELGE